MSGYNELYKTNVQLVGLSHLQLLETLRCTACIVDKTVHSTLQQLADMLVLFTVPGGTMLGKL